MLFGTISILVFRMLVMITSELGVVGQNPIGSLLADGRRCEKKLLEGARGSCATFM